MKLGTLLLIVLGAFILAGCSNLAPEVQVVKHLSSNPEYRISGSPLKYSYEELVNVTSPVSYPGTGGFPPFNATETCLHEITDYIYAFPGYKYEYIKGFSEKGNFQHEEGNLIISIVTEGLVDAEIATSEGMEMGDINEFEFFYDSQTKECTLLSMNLAAIVLPLGVYNKAMALALEHPSVQPFIDGSTQHGYELREWIDETKGVGAVSGEILNYIEFTKPVQGVIVFFLKNQDFEFLVIHVDLFNSEVFVEGPYVDDLREN